MTNVKTTRKALVLSGISLLLCFAMLLGTTFAWFTDSATSGTNMIQAGNLKIDIVDENGTSLVGDNLAFQNKNGETNILWEPGVTFRTQAFSIKNAGNLALKFTMALNGTTGSSELLEVITFSLVKADGTAVDLDSFIGTLTAGNSTELYYIQGKMDENAGNEYQGKTLTGIGITVSATQQTYETDSFDNQYDAGLTPPDEDGMYRTLADGSVVFYYNEASGFGGRVRLISAPENVGAEYVVPSEVNDLGSALIGKTFDKVTTPAGLTYGHKSLEGVTIKEVVIADGATTVPNRLFYKANVENVVIPSSVTSLEPSAFQQVNMTELVVPASVETFGDHAFAASALEKITFEGKNLTFDNRILRECASLNTVVLNCDDVTFKNATINGDCWISNTGSNNPNYSHISFYVKNNTVASKLRTALGAELPSTTPIYVNGSAVVYSSAALETAIENAQNGDVIVLGSGNYVVPDSAQGKTLTIVGNGETVIATQDDGSYEGCDYSLDGSTVTFENIVINTDSQTYTGYARCNGTYKNCTINGTYTLYGDSVFEGCTFNISGDAYNIWTWGASNATFTDCIFNSDGKAMLLYGTVSTNLTIDGCTFNDNGGLTDKKAAIEIGNDYGVSYNLIVNETTVNGYEINDKGINTGTTLWGNKNSMGTDKLNVVVDGVDVY